MSRPMRKLIPTILIVLISAAMIGTSTYAWFSMNNKVNVTGMTVTTIVSESLLIADDSLTSTSKLGDDKFTNTMVKSVTGSVLLEPVSTNNGKDFFYTDKRNVKGNGAAMNETFTAYNPADRGAFNTNYGFDAAGDAYGYYDYVFQMKAVNDATLSEIRLTKLDLTYGGNTLDVTVGNQTISTKAYRVAVFYEDITAGAATNGPVNLLAMFTPEGAKNFKEGDSRPWKAVSAVNSRDDVTYCSANDTAKIQIAAGETRYYKFVVRLWLEGEDTTCRNDTYIRLTDAWNLDLEFDLVSADEDANSVIYINQGLMTPSRVTMGTAQEIAAERTHVINDIRYFALTGEKITIDGVERQIYVTSTTDTAPAALTPYIRYYVVDDSIYVTDVTNRIQFNPTIVKSTYSDVIAVTLDEEGKMKETVSNNLVGSSPAAYAWKKADGTAAPGTNYEATYTAAVSGTYFCYITTDDGKVYKTDDYNVINYRTLNNGDIIANLDDVTSYQWEKVGTPDEAVIDGTVQVLTPDLASNAGTYYCVVKKASIDYYTLPVTVVGAEKATTAGTVTVDAGKLTNDVTVAASDAYAWYKQDGTKIAGATAATYVNTADTAVKVYCVVKDTDGNYYRTQVLELDAVTP